MNAQEKENIARAIIANRSTDQLCEMFEATNNTDREKILEQAMVRGWIMDELEKRDAEAFERWINSDDRERFDRWINCDGNEDIYSPSLFFSA